MPTPHSLRVLAALLLLVGGVSRPLAAQLAAPRAAPLAAEDSALVARILLAEERRDGADPALADGLRHADARLQVLAARARERISDPAFSRRDSLPGADLPAPRAWPEPAWKIRYRALSALRDDCAAMLEALRDPEPPVRLRAADLLRASCAPAPAITATLARWVDGVPRQATQRAPGRTSWHEAGHGVVALARVLPDSARPRTRRLATHAQWQLRQRAARAAAITQDTALLLVLVRDRDANVVEAAVEGLAALTGHASDSVYMRLIRQRDAQVVRVAAVALAGSSDPDVPHQALVAFERFAARQVASERDVRVALLAAAGRPPTDDRAPARPDALPTDAVALALGAERYLQVTMSGLHGGGRFTVRLRGDVAPIMAARVLDLARGGHYDRTTWHRGELDFVLQGGSPGANEYVGSARFLVDELGTVPHARGTVGMSTRGHDTGDAQWFVNLRENLRLGRDYTVFAEVVAGMDVVDEMLEGDQIASVREVSAPE
jgi:cyclophilin family peptidyl-prolyl cis-trans isomerase